MEYYVMCSYPQRPDLPHDHVFGPYSRWIDANHHLYDVDGLAYAWGDFAGFITTPEGDVVGVNDDGEAIEHYYIKAYPEGWC